MPGLTGQRLVLILHAVREGVDVEHPDLRRPWVDASDADRAAIEALASELGAEVPVAAVAGNLEQYRGRPEYGLWRLLSTAENPSLPALWLARVRAATGPIDALRTGVRLLLPKRQQLYASLGREPTRGEMLGAYRDRLQLGLREITQLVRRRLS